MDEDKRRYLIEWTDEIKITSMPSEYNFNRKIISMTDDDFNIFIEQFKNRKDCKITQLP